MNNLGIDGPTAQWQQTSPDRYIEDDKLNKDLIEESNSSIFRRNYRKENN